MHFIRQEKENILKDIAAVQTELTVANSKLAKQKEEKQKSKDAFEKSDKVFTQKDVAFSKQLYDLDSKIKQNQKTCEDMKKRNLGTQVELNEKIAAKGVAQEASERRLASGIALFKVMIAISIAYDGPDSAVEFKMEKALEEGKVVEAYIQETIGGDSYPRVRLVDPVLDILDNSDGAKACLDAGLPISETLAIVDANDSNVATTALTASSAPTAREYWIRCTGPGEILYLQSYDESLEIQSSIAALEEDRSTVESERTKISESIPKLEEEKALKTAEQSENKALMDSEREKWTTLSLQCDKFIAEAEKEAQEIRNSELDPRQLKLKEIERIIQSLKDTIDLKNSIKLSKIKLISELLQPENPRESRIPLNDDDAFALFFFLQPNAHAVISAIVLLSQYVVMDGLLHETPHMNWDEWKPVAKYSKLNSKPKVVESFQKNIFIPSWNSQWLRPYAHVMLQQSLEISYCESVDGTGAENSRSQSILSYLNTCQTAKELWTIENSSNPALSDESSKVILQAKVGDMIKSFCSKCKEKNVSSDQISANFNELFDELQVSAIESLLISTGVQLNNSLVLPPSSLIPGYKQYSITDERSRSALQWAVGNKFDDNVDRVKPSSIHENFALSQQYTERPLWMVKSLTTLCPFPLLVTC